MNPENAVNNEHIQKRVNYINIQSCMLDSPNLPSLLLVYISHRASRASCYLERDYSGASDAWRTYEYWAPLRFICQESINSPITTWGPTSVTETWCAFCAGRCVCVCVYLSTPQCFSAVSTKSIQEIRTFAGQIRERKQNHNHIHMNQKANP